MAFVFPSEDLGVVFLILTCPIFLILLVDFPQHSGHIRVRNDRRLVDGHCCMLSEQLLVRFLIQSEPPLRLLFDLSIHPLVELLIRVVGLYHSVGLVSISAFSNALLLLNVVSEA